MTGNAEGDEIRQLARRYQYDRYVAALLMPRAAREPLIVLTAYASELQRIPFLTSEPMMAAVRLQWWRDELTAAAVPGGEGRRTGHMLCDALVEVAGHHGLPFGLLQGMIDAAETELDATPFSEAAETRQVLIKFDGALFEMAGRILGAEAPRDVWLDAAVAYGAAQWAADALWRQSNGLQTYVSREVEVEDGPPGRALAEMAQDALATVQNRYATLDRAAKGALLPLATIVPLLRLVALETQKTTDAADATPAQQSNATMLQLSEFARARAVLWAQWRKRI